MDEDKLVFDITSGEIQREIMDKKPKEQNITINDASSETAKHLVKEWGSDAKYKVKGKVDMRRMSNITGIDVYWLMFFKNIPKTKGGDYCKDVCEEFLNLRDSVNAQHKKLQIGFMNAITGRKEEDTENKKRNIIQKITGRGKENE